MTRTIIVVEGEKAAEALWARHIPAVATVCGASSAPNEPVLFPLLPFEIFLWPDADEAGQKHMNIVAARLAKMGNVPMIIRWDQSPPKGDAADFPADRDVQELINNATLWAGQDDYEAVAQAVLQAYEERTPVEENGKGGAWFESQGHDLPS